MGVDGNDGVGVLVVKHWERVGLGWMDETWCGCRVVINKTYAEWVVKTVGKC